MEGEVAYLRMTSYDGNQPYATGPFTLSGSQVTQGYSSESLHPAVLNMILSRVAPTGATNIPRSWGALACAYLGVPSTV